MKHISLYPVLTAVILLLSSSAAAARSLGMCMAVSAEPDTVAPMSQYGFGNRQFEIDEVVVVSQPKETRRLREQPLSATSFTSPGIDELAYGSLQQLSLYTPSFAMPQYGSRFTSSIYVRGVGARTGYSPVAMYVDGMPVVNRSAHNMYLYETERVDVLRGPQGTLYGQNAEGGLLRVFTRSPLRTKGTFIDISAANGRQKKAQIAHYMPLGSKVGIAAAMFTNMQRGFIKNTNLHQYNDSLEEMGGRLRLTWQPRQTFTFDVIADYQHDRENAFPYGLVTEKGAFAQLPSTTFMNKYRRHLLRTGVNMAWQLKDVHLFSNTSYQYLRDKMVMDQDYVARDYFSLRQNQLHNALTQEFVARSPQTANGRYGWLFGLYGAYQWMKTDAPVDFGEGITSPISMGVRNAMMNAMVQQMKQIFIARGMTEEQAVAAALQMIEQRGGISMTTTMTTPGQFHTPEYNIALYHESTYALTPRLSLTAGLRYDYSHVALRYNTHSLMEMTADVMGTVATNSLLSVLRHSARTHSHQLLPKVALTLTTDMRMHSNVYLQVSKGYRSGGFNLQMFSDVLRKELNDNAGNAMQGSYEVTHDDDDYRAINRTISYKPEVSWNFEAGTHQNIMLNTRGDGMLRIDASIFFMQVRNQQLSMMAGNYGYGRRMVNAGRSHSCGMELALSGNMLDNRLNWMINYSFNNATFREYKDVLNAGTATETAVNYRGNHVPFAPAHMLSAAADWRMMLNSRSWVKSLLFGADMHMQGKTYWNETNTQYQNIYALLGARITADFGTFALSLWGRNLTDTRYHTFLIESSATGEMLSFAQRGTPRQIGLDFKIHIK